MFRRASQPSVEAGHVTLWRWIYACRKNTGCGACKAWGYVRAGADIDVPARQGAGNGERRSLIPVEYPDLIHLCILRLRSLRKQGIIAQWCE